MREIFDSSQCEIENAASRVSAHGYRLALILFSLRMTPLAKRLGLVTALCVLLSGCAQTGPPLPPSLELPKPPDDLRPVRKGDRVTLTWSVPGHTADRQTVPSLGPTL